MCPAIHGHIVTWPRSFYIMFIYIYIKYITFVILVRQPSTFRHVALHIFEIHLISCYMLACQHVGITISIIHNKLCALDGMLASSYKHINGQPLYICMLLCGHVSMLACQRSSTYYFLMHISALTW